jgi:prepilin-type processing-associated H-X9-DG protein
MLELVLVVGICGVLTGLVLAGIHRLRASAARTQCGNNLHQLGVACWAHMHLHRRFPVACTMPYAQQGKTPSITDASGIPPIEVINDSGARVDSDPNQPFGPNWAVYLLPFIDRSDLYAAARVESYLAGYKSGNVAQRDQWRAAVQGVSVPLYLCPADVGQETPFAGYPKAPGPWARGNYAANAGPGWWQMSLGGGWYQESYGMTGPVMGINYGARADGIPDGLTNTILLNEVRAGLNDQDPRGAWALGYPGASVTAANAIGDCTTPNDANDLSDDVEGCPQFWYAGIGTTNHMGCSTGYFNLGWPTWQAQARSRHAGGVNACFADGSVRFISDYVYQSVWFYMLSARDGVAYYYEDGGVSGTGTPTSAPLGLTLP